MRAISDNQALRGVDAQRSTNFNELMRRWRESLADIWDSVLSEKLLPRIRENRCERRISECAPDGQPAPVADDAAEPITAGPPQSAGESEERQLVPLPDERAQALAVMCDRLLRELDGAEVESAEIRFVVHKPERSDHPRLDPAWSAEAGDGELVWELRRLIAWSGGTIADVARALEIRGADLDEHARELLNDEVAALDADLATLSVHLADPVDWDSEFEFLLAGEVTPFDDPVGDEDDLNDD